MDIIQTAPHICAQIGYDLVDGMPIHSDLCWQAVEGVPENPTGRVYFSETYKKFLHANLEEWFNNSGGTGYFYIGTYENMKEALES
jgi:hypothetical protein